MAALDFSTLADMESLVTELTGLAAPSDLDNLLDNAAATYTSGDDTATLYRPYIVAALVLDRQKNTKKLKSAEGAVFGAYNSTIGALYQQQYDADVKNAANTDDYPDFAVPKGYEAYAVNEISAVW